MATYHVLFERERDDEGSPVLPTDPTPAHFAQLCAELYMTLPLLGTHEVDGRFIFLTRIEHDGDLASLRDALQARYDYDGVAGYFTIARTVDQAHVLAESLRDLCELVESMGLDATPQRDVLRRYNGEA